MECMNKRSKKKGGLVHDIQGVDVQGRWSEAHTTVG